MGENDELKRLCDEAERALIAEFISEHHVIGVLVQASAEEIREWFCNVIRLFMDEGAAGILGLLALWLVMESSRDTLVNLAVWLETQGPPDGKDAPNPASDEE